MIQDEIANLRLHHLGIRTALFDDPSAVVAWLGASQAQDYAGAKWALGLRMQGARDGSIEQAFNAGAILRTHLLRPTWHFVTPADIAWLLTLTAPRVHAVNAFMYRQLALDRAVFARSHAALAGALQGGGQMTRDELRAVLQQAGISTDGGQRFSYLLMAAELDGVICSGARQGKQFTYALLDERAPGAKILARDEALAELAGRYFRSRGPASLQDFSKWSGLTSADARSGLDAVKDRLEQETVDGQTYWLSAAAHEQPVRPTAYLLSIYDEYISSYKDRSAIGEVEVGKRLKAMGNALTYIIVLDGQIVGTWKRDIGRDVVRIETNLFKPLSDAEQLAVAAAAQRFGAFLGLPVLGV
jgi:hypothetical protein